MRLLLWVLLCICYIIKADLINSIYKEFEIIPDIYDENAKIPDQLLTMYLGDEKMITGQLYYPTFLNVAPLTVQPPPNIDPNSYYLLIYLSPDWLSRDFPNLRHFLMWLVTNIPGKDFNVAKGDHVVAYMPPGPIKSAKRPGRYLFALYRQPQGNITIDIPHTAARELGIRQLWSIKDFVGKYNLGDPIAINLIQSQYDSFVPILHKEFMQFKKSKR